MRGGLISEEEPRGMSNVSLMVWKYESLLKKNAKDVAIGIVSGIVIANVFFLNLAYADVDTTPKERDDRSLSLMIAAMQNESRPYGKLPSSAGPSRRRLTTIPVTAYSSDVEQTDSTPCIAARGFDLCTHNEEDVIAANFLPMGARVRIPDLYGTRVFTVVDRMNARYSRRLDVWMREREDAKNFGIKYATIEVL